MLSITGFKALVKLNRKPQLESLLRLNFWRRFFLLNYQKKQIETLDNRRFRGKVGVGLWLGLWLLSLLVGACNVSFDQSHFEHYPPQFQVGEGSTALVYFQQSGYFALHYPQPGDLPGDLPDTAILVFEGEGIAVFSGLPTGGDRLPAGTQISPVYSLQVGGSLAVPTGQVFLRFPEDVEAQSRQQMIRNAGYEIVEIPAYAPYSAWVRAGSGRIADALANLSRLQVLPDVAAVEPQMLMQRVKRQPM